MPPPGIVQYGIWGVSGWLWNRQFAVARITGAPYKVLVRGEFPSCIDGIAVVADDAAGFAIHSNCAGRIVPGQVIGTADAIPDPEAINGVRSVTIVGWPNGVIGGEMSDLIVRGGLTDVALPEEYVEIRRDATVCHELASL